VRNDLVLRGGVVTAHYVAPHPRLIDDIDLLTLYPFSEERVRHDVAALLAAEVADDHTIEMVNSEIIWGDTEFPGLRLSAEVDGEPAQIDVGSGDPLVGGPTEILLGPLQVQACRAETLVAWKLHGLYERGPGRWRPKDLHDIDLLSRHANLDQALVARSIPVAFESRGDEMALMERLVTGVFGQSDWSLRKWARFREDSGPEMAPGELNDTVARVSEFLRSLPAI
jgi:hypothetical protein